MYIVKNGPIVKSHVTYASCVLSLLLWSCSNSSIELSVVDSGNLDGACGIRSIEQVSNIATEAVAVFNSRETRVAHYKQISEIIPCYNNATTKSSSSQLVYYVVNFENNAGFVVVGASVSMPEIVVYSDSGNYNGVRSQNEGLNIYMAEISQQLSSFSQEPLIDIPSPSHMEKKENTSTNVNEPLVQVSWHQESPFNWYCSSPFDSQVPVGCVAVAVAQIMTVYSYPSLISLTYDNDLSSSISLDWDEMVNPMHQNDHGSTCQYCIQNASLLREIGERVGMSYGVGGSGAASSKVVSALSSFGYKHSSYDDYSLSGVIASLCEGSPVYIRATDGTSGHAWVVDGSKYICKNTKTYEVSSTILSELVADEYVEQWYLHFNYGWGGASDGYYLACQKEHGSGRIIVGGSYDDTLVSMFTGVGGLSHDVKTITNIYPE